MAHHEPPHQDLCCLQSQLFSSQELKELSVEVILVVTECVILWEDMDFNFKSCIAGDVGFRG